MKRSLTKSQKETVAAKQNFKCANSIEDYKCPLWQKSSDKGIFGEEKYHIDHIIELADGGTDSRDNLQALCLSCHTVKTNRNKSIRKNNIKKKVKIDLQTFLSKYKFDRIHSNKTRLFLYSSNPYDGTIYNSLQIQKEINLNSIKINIYLSITDRVDQFNDFKTKFNDILDKSKINKLKFEENQIRGYMYKTVNFNLQDVLDYKKINKVENININTWL